MIAAGVDELAPVVGTRDACAALAVPRASHTTGAREGGSRDPRGHVLGACWWRGPSRR